MNKPIIGKIENLSFSYEEGTMALDGVSFSIYEGENISIIGHNGSGKSTLAKILVGLLPKFSGSINLFGIDLNQKTIGEIRSKVGIVFQNPDNQFVGSTVEDDIAFGLENRNVPQNEMKSIIDEFCELVDMKDFLNKEPSNLSGGQKQRVAIAGVLAMGPDLIILDESTSMLDPKGRSDISNLISSIRKKNPKLTVLSITHDIEEAYKSDRLLVLYKGKIAKDGKPFDVFNDIYKHEEMKLDVPFFIRLKNELIEKGISIPDSVRNIEALEDYLCK